MESNKKHKPSIIRRSLGMQATLLIVGITILTLGASSLISIRFDNAAMHVSMEETAKEVSGLLRLIIDKPMVIGDDTGTTEEFAFLARKFPSVSISIASFTGKVTYSTRKEDVRKDLSELFSGVMSKRDDSLFENNYRAALKGETPRGTLLTVDGKNNFLHVSPILNEKNCHHCHGASQPVLGAMAVLQDVGPAIAEASKRTLRNVVGSAIGGLLLVAGIYIFIKRRLINRLDGLEGTSNRILEGDFNARFTVSGADELGRLAGNLGNMLQSLKQLGVAQSVLNGLSMPGAMCDREENILFVNQPLLTLLADERGAEALIGTPINRLIYQSDAHPDSVFSKVLATGTVCLDSEQGIRSSRGAELRVRFDANPVTDLEGNLIGAFAGVTDLTAIRRNEAAIMEKNATISQTAQEAGVLTEEMGRAINALAGQIENTREQASRQQALSDSTVAELDEVNQAMASVAENSSQVAGHAGDTKESAVQGAAQAGRVAEGMQSMVEATRQLKEQMEELSRKIEGIGQIMQVIQDIADQTNLLALNAAIEAARAGDAGRGFAVVADEVRKLAEKTMQSTVEVGRTVNEIRESTATSIQAVERTTGSVQHSSEQVAMTGEALQRILALAESVAEEVHAIAAAAEQQSSSVESVRGSISSIRDISEDAATATSETETAVRSLMGIADRLNNIVAGMTAKEK